MKFQILFALALCVAVAFATDAAPKTEIHSIHDLAEKVYNDVTNDMGKERSALFTARDFMKVAELKYLTNEGRALVDSAMEYLPSFTSIFGTISNLVSSAASGVTSSKSGSATESKKIIAAAPV